jgi:hypothetical protein
LSAKQKNVNERNESLIKICFIFPTKREQFNLASRASERNSHLFSCFCIAEQSFDEFIKIENFFFLRSFLFCFIKLNDIVRERDEIFLFNFMLEFTWAPNDILNYYFVFISWNYYSMFMMKKKVSTDCNNILL